MYRLIVGPDSGVDDYDAAAAAVGAAKFVGGRLVVVWIGDNFGVAGLTSMISLTFLI